ncbi:MAG: hypothetical protein ACKOQ8_07205 [Micrococcales bacterium]
MSKHRKQKPLRTRLVARLSPALVLGALLIPLTTLQSANAAQDANHPADANLWASAATCNAVECWWDFAETNLGYFFSKQTDGANRESVMELEVQSIATPTTPAQNWRVLLNDPSAITVVDFYHGTPRFWVGPDIALQADANVPGVVAYNQQRAHDLHPGTLDASVTGPVARIHQVFTPQVTSTFLTAATEADIANFGPDISAIGRIEFSEAVTELQLGDIVPTPDSTGCRVDSITDSGDAQRYDVIVRGCSSLTLNLMVVANSVFGHAPGPMSDSYWAPIQPYVPAQILAPPLPMGGAQPSSGGSAPTPSSTPTAAVTPSPSVTPMPTSQPTTPAAEPVAVVTPVATTSSSPTPMISTPANVEPEIVAPTIVQPTIVDTALNNEAPTVNQQPSALTEVTRRVTKQVLPVLPLETSASAIQAATEEKQSVTAPEQAPVAGDATTGIAGAAEPTGVTAITVTAITATILTAAIVFARRGRLITNLRGWRGRIRVRKPAF